MGSLTRWVASSANASISPYLIVALDQGSFSFAGIFIFLSVSLPFSVSLSFSVSLCISYFRFVLFSYIVKVKINTGRTPITYHTANNFEFMYSRNRISHYSFPKFIYIFPKLFMIFCQELLDPKRNYENQIWTSAPKNVISWKKINITQCIRTLAPYITSQYFATRPRKTLLFKSPCIYWPVLYCTRATDVWSAVSSPLGGLYVSVISSL